MNQKIFHSWNLSYKNAIILQKYLAKKLILQFPKNKKVNIIGGLDLSFNKKRKMGFAVLTIFSYPEWSLIDVIKYKNIIEYPYISGLLSFREGPLITRLLSNVEYPIDILMFDGQGILHPRLLGIAAHIGLLFQIPTIGVAKSRLVGEYELPRLKKGNKSPIYFKNKKMGYLLVSRDNVKPLFISPGHLMDVETAVKFVIEGAIKYRLPEPTRLAHNLSEKYKRESKTS